MYEVGARRRYALSLLRVQQIQGERERDISFKNAVGYAKCGRILLGCPEAQPEPRRKNVAHKSSRLY